MIQKKPRKTQRCQICGQRTVIVNKIKKLCKTCGSQTSTKSWVIGLAPTIKEILTQHVKEGYSLTRLSIEYDVTEQTMVNWFKRYIGVTYRCVKKELCKEEVLIN